MKEIKEIFAEHQSLKLHEIIDHDRFGYYAIVHHSSGIEGSTLTENETRLLLEEGTTPKGKPLEHSLMVKDHYDALLFVIAAAEKKRSVDVSFIQQINAKVMRHTGSVHHTVFGEIDASKGSFRKGNVSAGGSYFIGYEKVEAYTRELAERVNQELPGSETVQKKLVLAFTAHFDLVSIHPFYDGNGRSSRLLMNYIQAFYGLPLARVYQEDKADYFTALTDSRKQETVEPFVEFMFAQYKKFLLSEIQQYKQDMSRELKPGQTKKKGRGLSLFF